ncbi:MAG: proline--tRNA ligase [Betaproteobacteria bacterium]|nr:proline--tRNA ligase [Betaproteobacteria bacterium]
MKASRFHIATLKEAPSDAEIVSHRLMTRAGMIRRLAGGIYNYMPMGLRTIRKIEAIIREEMDAAGAIELLMPVIQPAELWMESGRWERYGPELLRIKDRHGRDFIVQPTSEEVITDIARQEIRSYRQMPKNFYHIQTKFRDERRPRFGLMRGREFTMKDAYSFDRSKAAALASYQAMFEAYTRIFTRIGLAFRAVAADTGAIGGSASHEFQVIADTGEDAIAYCPTSEFAANIELAEALPLFDSRAPAGEPLVKTPTPGRSTCAEVADLLGLPLSRTAKSLVLAVDDREKPKDGADDPDSRGRIVATRVFLLLVRGDHDLNEVKAGKVAGLEGFRFATETEIIEHFGTPPGYLGPIGLVKPVTVVADRTVARMSDFVCGANDAGYHYTGVNWGRDLPEPIVADIRNVREGDPSPDGQGTIAIQRGIEVGHVFYLGTKYSEAMRAVFVDEDGASRPVEMGCYGIGVTRLLGAAIEQNHDARGIIWPAAIAPFEVVICPVGFDRSEAVRDAALGLYTTLLEAGVDVILDDRGERPGAMFADWELIGVPLRITVGDRGLKEGRVELQGRRDTEPSLVAPAEAANNILARLGRKALSR